MKTWQSARYPDRIPMARLAPLHPIGYTRAATPIEPGGRAAVIAQG